MRRRFLPVSSCALAIATAASVAYGEGRSAPASTTAHAKSAPTTAARAPAASAKRAPDRNVPASRVWHTLPPGKTAPVDGAGRPMLTLQALNIPDRVTIAASSDHGGFSAEDLDRAAHVLRDPRTGNEHPIDPRALDLVYRVAVHFSAPEVRIISGYRTPRGGATSNHARGRAIDLVIPGTSDEEVARFAREEGFCGVGVYPTSGFLHLDVRPHSYFWIDRSGPGQRNRTRGILPDLAAKSDARALARGDRAIAPFVVSSDVDAALAELRTADNAAGAPSFDEDDDDDAPAP
jgi:uncharacterized protein YcbK (DUF882 family)